MTQLAEVRLETEGNVVTPIRQLRERAGLTLRDIEDDVGASYSTISRWERKNEIPQEHQERYARAVGVSYGELRDALEKAREAPSAVQHVDSERDLREWTTRVALSDHELQARALLAALAAIINREHWVVVADPARVSERARIDEAVVRRLWPQVLSSAFVSRLEGSDVVLSLTIPSDDE